MLVSRFLYQAPVGATRNPHLPGLEKKHLNYRAKNFLFHSPKIDEGSILSHSIRYTCVAQRKFENQGLTIGVRKISALIDDWENIGKI